MAGRAQSQLLSGARDDFFFSFDVADAHIHNRPSEREEKVNIPVVFIPSYRAGHLGDVKFNERGSINVGAKGGKNTEE